MPLPVKKIRWRCEQCRKHRWLKPYQARGRRFCSRVCLYASQQVERPAETKPKRTFGERICDHCRRTYIARTGHQRYCSQTCSTHAIHEARRKVDVGPRPCEHCGRDFRPRPNNAGRFCSRPCTYAGQRSEKAAHWKGGRHVRPDGYVLAHAPGHPAARGRGQYVKEHRLVMEKILGRYLTKGESVHHKNGNRADNRPENLELRVAHHGTGATAPHCRTCTCFSSAGG